MCKLYDIPRERELSCIPGCITHKTLTMVISFSFLLTLVLCKHVGSENRAADHDVKINLMNIKFSQLVPWDVYRNMLGEIMF